MAHLKPIDPEQVRALAAINCTYPEMCAVLGVSDETLRARFSPIIEAGRAIGRQSLRRAQWKAAVEKGNIQMLIWLGRQLLGQTDKLDVNLTLSVPKLQIMEEDTGTKTVVELGRPNEITDAIQNVEPTASTGASDVVSNSVVEVQPVTRPSPPGTHQGS